MFWNRTSPTFAAGASNRPALALGGAANFSALPSFNDLNGAQRLNGLNDLNVSPFYDVIDTFSQRRYSFRKR